LPCHVDQNSKIAKLEKNVVFIYSCSLWSNGKGVVLPEDDEHDVVDGEGGDDTGGYLNDARHQDTRPKHSQSYHSNSRKPS
jgi:hypothetical protein